MAMERRRLGTRVLRGALALAVGFGAGCSSKSARPDAGDASDLAAERGPCRQAVDAAQPFGPCPPQFDDPSWRSELTCLDLPAVSEGSCEAGNQRAIDYGTHRWTCYYAPGPTGMFLGAVFTDDTTSFCEHSAYEVQIGETPAPGSCTSLPVQVTLSCDAGADSADVGPDAAADVLPDAATDRAEVEAGRCTLALSEVASSCPATYDVIFDTACQVAALDGGTSTSSCGNYLIFARRALYDSFVCYYDATSHGLVALAQCTDYNAYCGGADYCYWAGAPVGACEVSHLTLTNLRSSVCPGDGGIADGDAPG